MKKKNRNFLLKKAFALGTSFAFVCSLFFWSFTHQEVPDTGSKSTKFEVAHVVHTSLDECSHRFKSDDTTERSTTSTAPSCPLDDTKVEYLAHVFCISSPLEFLDLTRSYQYFRLDVLRSQAHPPTILV